MAISKLDNFYLNQPEPTQGCMLALRDLILSYNEQITPEWKYGLPFFYYKGKMLCYIWKRKDKLSSPYLGFMDGKLLNHEALKLEKRKRVMTLDVNPTEDLDTETIEILLSRAMKLIETKVKKP